jgi:quercetin dioxygenase-like cupin family protein
MRTSRVAGLLFLATATLAQLQQSVEITSEPSHHLVFQNEYVRVFDVTVAPRATTLIHKHNHDYLFVTLGDSDVVSERVGEKPAALQLKDGEVRFTLGNFAHAAINKSDRPFHNITIELLKPTTNEQPCTVNCSRDSVGAETFTRLYASDQWAVSLVTLSPKKSHTGQMGQNLHQLIVAVSDVSLELPTKAPDHLMHYNSGDLEWVPDGFASISSGDLKKIARFVVLEFNPQQAKP